MKVTFTQKFCWSPHGYDYEEFQEGETVDVPELCFQIAKSLNVIKAEENESDNSGNNAGKSGRSKTAAKHTKLSR